MANPSDPGSGNPSPGTHPRMTAPLPAGPGSPGTSRAEGSLSQAAGSLKEKISQTASDVVGQVGSAWESAREGVRQSTQDVARRARNFWDDAGSLIRRNPMAAVAVAFGAGCLVGYFLSSGSRSRADEMTERMSRASA
jgi:ElaB/YqjD/DUF883 family membrane-anchored ribosome-binding protein